MAVINPCPKCGGEAKFIKLFDKNRYDGFVKCTNCNAEGRVYTSKQNAVKAWNEGRSIYSPPERRMSMKCKHKDSCGFDICLEDDCSAYDPVPETNGDILRMMSDDMLGRFLCRNMMLDCSLCPGTKYCSAGQTGLIKWLGLPAEGEIE